MSEIKKIQVDGVVYDLTASGENFENQIKELDNKIDTEIQKEAERTDNMINQLNENVNSSITELSNNLVDSVNTINEEIEEERKIREEADNKLQESIDAITGAAEDVVKYKEFEYAGEKRKTIELANNDSISGLNTEGNGYNLVEVSKWNKAEVGSANIQLNLNSTGRPQVNDKEEIAYVSDVEKATEGVVKETVAEDGRKTIYLDNHENICGFMPDNQTAVNVAMVSKFGKVDLGSASVELNLNGISDHPTYNDTEKIALLKDLEGASAEDIKKLEEKVDGIDTKVNDLTNTVVESNSALNTRIDEESSKLNKRVDEEVLPAISELDKNKVEYFEADKNGIKTRNILLENYASILGKNTEGVAHNLVMLSKWNKVDIGASGVELNFNGSTERPTYNDDKKLALLEDIQGTSETINLVKKDDLTYELQVGDRIAGTISIPKDQFLKDVVYNGESKELVFTFETLEGDKVSSIDMSSLVDTYIAGNGLSLDVNSFSIKLDPSTEAFLKVSDKGIKVVGINAAINTEKERAEGVETKLQEDLSYIADTVIPEMNSNTAKALDSKVSWDESKKVISLPKDGSISALRDEETLEGGVLLAQRTYDEGASFVTEVGTAKNKLTLNASERPQVDIAGTGSEKIAYLSDTVTGITYLGNFSNATQAENKALDLCQVPENCAFSFTVNNSRNGFIINSIKQDNSVIQRYWLDGKYYERDITSDKVSEGWVEKKEFNNYLPGKSIKFKDLVKLTTESTNEDIIKCLKSEFSSLITEEDLNECLTTGKLIKCSETQTGVIIGWTGQAWSFTHVGAFRLPSVLSIGYVVLKLDTNTREFSVPFNPISNVLPTKTSDLVNDSGYITSKAVNDAIFGYKSLGKVGSFNEIPEALADINLVGVSNNILISFVVSNKVYGEEGGFCISISSQGKVYQTLYWKDTIQKRTLVITDGEVTDSPEFITQKNPISEVTLSDRIVKFRELLELKKDTATSDQIKECLKSDAYSTVVSEDDLKECYLSGKLLRCYETNSGISVGWSGHGYTLTMVSPYRYANAPSIGLVEIAISEEGEYSLVYDPFTGVALTTESKQFLELKNNSVTKEEYDSTKIYQIDLSALSATDDSTEIDTIIGGWDNVVNAVNAKRPFDGSVANSVVPLSVIIFENKLTLSYLLDSVAGHILNAIDIVNTDGTLSKSIASHAMLTTKNVIDNAVTAESTLPVSANQVKILNDKLVDLSNKFEILSNSYNELLMRVSTLEKVSGNKVVDSETGKSYDTVKAAIEGGADSVSFYQPMSE